MKKVIFMMAAAAAFAFASCNSKTDNNAAPAESENPEAAAQTGEVGEGSEGPCTFECEKFSVDVPAGWKVLQVRGDYVRIGVGDDHTKDAQIKVDARFSTLTTTIENEEKADRTEKLGEKTFGDNTFLVFQSDGHVEAFKKIDDDNFISANTWNVAVDDATLAAVLASVKVK